MSNNQITFDYSASTFITSDIIIKDIIHSEGNKATPAFGAPITSTASGTYGPLIIMEGMRETLVSVSQLCQGGPYHSQNIVILTSEDMRCFTYESHMSLTTVPMFLAQFKSASLSDHIHTVTVHPGNAVMALHRKKIQVANVAPVRDVCMERCVRHLLTIIANTEIYPQNPASVLA